MLAQLVLEKPQFSDFLFKFYENYSGEIFIEGRNLREISKKKEITNILGIIPQDVVLFNESVFFNISYEKLSESFKRVIASAKRQKFTIL